MLQIIISSYIMVIREGTEIHITVSVKNKSEEQLSQHGNDHSMAITAASQKGDRSQAYKGPFPLKKISTDRKVSKNIIVKS